MNRLELVVLIRPGQGARTPQQQQTAPRMYIVIRMYIGVPGLPQQQQMAPPSRLYIVIRMYRDIGVPGLPNSSRRRRVLVFTS